MHLSLKAFLALLTVVPSTIATAHLLPEHIGKSTLKSRHDGDALEGVDGKTINPLNCTYPSKMFRQLVNHPTSASNFSGQGHDHEQDSGDTKTFLQQYKVIDDYFKPGGPIMFFQGAEHELECFEIYSLFEYAIEVGALVVGIEHRFFGLSVPGNLSYENQLGWPASAMSSLTLENVLMDSVELVKWVKSTVPGAQDSHVIAFGGSYAGVLVSLLRIHFPGVFFGAFPSSPVSSGFVSDPHDPLAFSMGDWVCQSFELILEGFAYRVILQDSQVVQDASANASAKIKYAFQDLRQRITAHDLDGLKEDLRSVTATHDKPPDLIPETAYVPNQREIRAPDT